MANYSNRDGRQVIVARQDILNYSEVNKNDYPNNYVETITPVPPGTMTDSNGYMYKPYQGMQDFKN